MAELSSRQLEILTKDAEAGQGCALSEQFANLNIGEQLEAMHGMRDVYAKECDESRVFAEVESRVFAA